MIVLKEIFLRDLKSRLKSEEEALINGAGSDYAEVQLVRGRIQGLRTSLDLFEEVLEKLIESEDLLEEDYDV